MRELLRHRDLRYFFAGQGISLFGSMSLWLAAGIWVKTLTDSYGAAGMVFFCITLGTLAAPLSGLVVDRISRRRLLIATNLSATLLLVPLVMTGGRPLWLVYAVLVGYGALHGLIASGQSALLAGMVPDRLLPHANGALRTIQESLRLVAPLAGAGLYAWQGFSSVVILTLVGFLVAAGTLAAIRYRETPLPRKSEPFFASVSAGMRHLLRIRALRGLTISSALALSVLGFSESAIFAVVEEGLGRSTEFVGVLMTLQGIGAIVAGPMSGPLVGRIGELRLAAAGLLLFAVGILLAITPSLVAVVSGVVLAGGAVPWLVVGATTLLQRRSPPELHGRAYAAFDFSITVPQTLSIAVGAALISVVGYQVLMTATAGVTTLAALLLFIEHRRDVSTVPLDGAANSADDDRTGSVPALASPSSIPDRE